MSNITDKGTEKKHKLPSDNADDANTTCSVLIEGLKPTMTRRELLTEFEDEDFVGKNASIKDVDMSQIKDGKVIIRYSNCTVVQILLEMTLISIDDCVLKVSPYTRSAENRSTDTVTIKDLDDNTSNSRPLEKDTNAESSNTGIPDIDSSSNALAIKTPGSPKQPLKIEQTFWPEKAQLIPDYKIMEKIDEHVLSTPNNLRDDPQELVAYLVQPCKTEIEKARAVIHWMGKNIEYDTAGLDSNTIGNQSALTALKTGKAVCEGFGNVCLLLASLAGLECKTLSGQAKGAGYHSGKLDPSTFQHGNHAWNAIKINSKFYLFDATWAAGGRDATTNLYNQRWDESWFLTHPDDFSLTHLPLKDDIQFTKELLNITNKIDPNAWVGNPLLCPQATVYGIKPISHFHNVIETSSSELIITFSCGFPLEIHHMVTRSEEVSSTTTNPFVALFKDADTRMAVIRLPGEGSYELRIFGYIRNNHKDLAVSLDLLSYKIVSNCTDKPKAFPKGLNTQWGITPCYQKANFKLMSPQNHIIKTNEGEANILYRPFNKV